MISSGVFSVPWVVEVIRDFLVVRAVHDELLHLGVGDAFPVEQHVVEGTIGVVLADALPPRKSARALSAMRARMTYPPTRDFGLAGATLVRSLGWVLMVF